MSSVKKNPLITVAVICYNYEEYVEEAINSVLDQEYKNIELIVINDGSTDDSEKKVKKILRDKPGAFKYITQHNRGIVATRNRVVSEATGEYIVQLDADDYIPRNYVRTLVDSIDGSDIYYTEAIDPATSEVKVVGVEFDLEKIKLRNFIHSSSMYRLSTLKKWKYDELLSDKALEDWDINLSMCLGGARAKFIPGTYLNYRQHEDSRSSQSRRTMRSFEAIEYILAKHIKHSPDQMSNIGWSSLNISRMLREVNSKASRITALEEEVRGAKRSLSQIRSNYAYLKASYRAVTSSKSYRIGRVVLLPFRISKRLLIRVKRKVGIAKRQYRLLRHIAEIYEIKGRSKKLKIDVIIRSYYHPMSSMFIRLLSPLTYGSLGGDVNLRLVDGDKYKLRRSVNAVIVQRTAISDMGTAERLVEELRRKDIKLFVDTDDAFGNLDKNHPQYSLQKERSDALRYIIENADEVWYSTENLSKIYNTKRFKVIRNTLDPRAWPRLGTNRIRPIKDDAPLRLVYMGTTTHSEDFDMIVPALEKLYMERRGKFELHVIGVSTALEGKYPWLVVHKPKSALYPDFTKWFSTELPRFDLGLSPLVDSAFNRAKSDIKCLDYMASGVTPMVSDVAAYKNKELDDFILRVPNTSDDWFMRLKQEIDNRHKNRQLRVDFIRAGINYINTHRSVKVASQEIEDSIRSIVKK